MALSARLEMRQGLGLVITPQLQQAIKMLQLSSVELDAYIEGELERNPLLQREESDGEAPGASESASADAGGADAPETPLDRMTNEGAGESLDALETVQAFCREAGVSSRFTASVEKAFGASMRRVRARAVLAALVICLVFAGLGAMLYMALGAVLIQHTMSAGVLLQFIILAVMAASSVAQIGEVMGEIQKAAGAMDRISEILHAEPGIAAPAHPVALPVPARGAISFEHVTFAYPGRPDLPALRDFTLTVKPGERVALVGPSGGGKSTVLRLLLRFYDPQEGVVRVDGVPMGLSLLGPRGSDRWLVALADKLARAGLMV